MTNSKNQYSERVGEKISIQFCNQIVFYHMNYVKPTLQSYKACQINLLCSRCRNILQH